MAETYKDAAAAMKSTKVTFKVSVLRCKKTGRVLFLEAGKDFVDTLLSFLLLPIGIIIHMLSDAGGQVKALDVGTSKIYKSVEKLDRSFLHVDKESLMQPGLAVAGTCGSTGLLQGLEAAPAKRPTADRIQLPGVYYGENSDYPSCNYVTITSGTYGSSFCNSVYHTRPMTVLPEDLENLKQMLIDKFVEEDEKVQKSTCSTGQGFVRENITYMVTDSLEVMASKTIRSIQVLNRLKVATLADLESTDISVGITQILQLLQSAITSSSCLNDVFTK